MKNGLLTVADCDTRSKRRAAVRALLSCLIKIRDAELLSLENVPVNLQGSESYELGENAVDILNEVIDLMSDLY